MLRTRLWALLCLTLPGLGPLFAVGGCGEDEATSRPRPGDRGSAGATLGGEGSSELGGTGASPSGGTMAEGGTTANGGVPSFVEAGATAGGNLGLGGTGDSPLGEQLELCARLAGLTEHAFNVEQAYAKTAIKDCRVKWVIPRKDDLVPFQNQLVVWSLQLWGCQGKPVENFALVAGLPALSQGDVAILIDEYLSAADQELDLSPPEFQEMKAALERLAMPLLASASADPSRPSCAVEMGGAGGAAGAGNGGAADGGVAGVGGAGGAPSDGEGGGQ